jgi:hypothetical protein
MSAFNILALIRDPICDLVYNFTQCKENLSFIHFKNERYDFWCLINPLVTLGAQKPGF